MTTIFRFSALTVSRAHRRALALTMGVAVSVLSGCDSQTAAQLGAEQIPESEASDIAKVIEMFQSEMVKRDGDGLTRRGAHPKHHGCVQANFRIDKNLPASLQTALFQPGRSHPALIRFSNNADPQADQNPDVRGMAIKLLEVPGETIIKSDHHPSTHDFLLVSHPVFLFPDVATYTQAFAAFAQGRALSFFFNPFDSHIKAFLIVQKMLAKHHDLLAIDWFSMVPYRYGAKAAAKYLAKPCDARAARPIPEDDDNFLGTRLQADIAQTGACFEFGVQMQSDPRAMPIEDPSVLWSERQAPMLRLARIEIPAQQISGEQRNTQCENLSFNPWTALPEHQPLGGISRARKHIYQHLSAYRHRRNGVSQHLPKAFNESEQRP